MCTYLLLYYHYIICITNRPPVNFTADEGELYRVSKDKTGGPRRYWLQQFKKHVHT